MTLTDPRLYYKTIRNGILVLLRQNKAELNVGLTRGKIVNDHQIRPGHPGVIPVNAEQYPTIMVKLSQKTESFEHVGNAGRKKPWLIWNIFGLVINPRLDMNADDDIMQLCANTESIFRDNISINDLTLWTDVRDVDFNVSDRFENDNYLDVFSLELYSRVEVK